MESVLKPMRLLFSERGLSVLLVCNLLFGTATAFIVPFYSMFGTLEVRMSPLLFGGFMTVTSVSAVAVSTALARWSDTRCSRRTMLVLGSACGALGYAGYAFVRDVLWLTVIGCTLLGVANIVFSQLFARARELLFRLKVPAAEVPLYMNVFRLSFALPWTVGPALAAWIMTFYAYRGLFLTAAAFYLALLVVVLRYIPAERPGTAGAPARLTPLRRVLRRSDLLAYFTGFVLVFAATTMCMMDLPLLVLEKLGGTKHDIGVIYSISPVFEVPLMFYFGLLAVRVDQARLIRRGIMIAIVYFSLLALVRAPWHVYPLQVLNAAMIAVIAGVAITFFQNYVPAQPGTATNLYASAQRTGSTAGYLLFGLLASALGYRAVFVVCAGLCVLSLVLLFIHRRQGAQPAALSAAAAA